MCMQLIISEPKPIRQLALDGDGEVINVTLTANELKYFSLQLNTQSKTQVVVAVTPVTDTSNLKNNIDYDFLISDLINQNYGRGVYTTDTLAAVGLLAAGSSNTNSSGGSSHSTVPLPKLPAIIKTQVRQYHEYN